MEMEMEMLLMKFESYLCDEEKSKSTINKYLHDVRGFKLSLYQVKEVSV